METLTFKLTDFEGPLDLLLTLVQKNKMKIAEIRITELIDQYLAVVNGQGEDIEASSEFVEMAARFVYMKSVFLLPHAEEAERLREELTGLLVEYSACKEVAAKLKSMAEGRDLFVREPMELQSDRSYKGLHEAVILRDAYFAASGRKTIRPMPQAEQFEELVAAPVVSVASKILYVLRGLVRGRFQKLGQLFHGARSRSDAVATFLAVLELIRAGRLTIDDDETMAVHKTQRKGV